MLSFLLLTLSLASTHGTAVAPALDLNIHIPYVREEADLDLEQQAQKRRELILESNALIRRYTDIQTEYAQSLVACYPKDCWIYRLIPCCRPDYRTTSEIAQEMSEIKKRINEIETDLKLLSR